MIVDCAVYRDGRRHAGDLALREAALACHLEDHFVWIGLHEPTEEEFDSVRREFELHELAVEDAIEAHQRPKIEEYGDSLFVVLKTARYVADIDDVVLGEINLFIGDGFVVSVRHGEASALSEVRREMEGRPELLRRGPGAVLHAIVDKVVDDYEPVVDHLEDDVDDVEAEVFSPSRQSSVERIYKLKREVLEFQHAVAPLGEPVMRLASAPLPHVDAEVRPYFRDVHDHVARVAERVEAYRDLLTAVLTANLTQASVQQNEDVRKISAWVAIVAVPTMIAGVYGMNFEHMPELGWTFGYPLALGVMLVACVGLYWHFKRVGWL
jgi:magnesium transporter